MKIIKLFLILVSFLLFTSAVNAITTYGEFQNQQSTININYGQSVYFDAVLFSMNPPIDYSVKMYDNNLNLVKTFEDAITNNNFVSNRYTIAQADYQNNQAYTIIIQGLDDKGDQSPATLTLNVGNVLNNAPILNIIGNQQVNEGQLLQFTVTATDPDNNPITLSATSLPTGATFQDNGNGNGVFSWTPSFTQSGNYNLRFIVSDSSLQDFEDITITVVDVPQGSNPTVVISRPQANEVVSGVYNILWTATDPDQTANTLDIRIEYTYNGYLWTILEDLQDNNDGVFTWDTLQLSDANDYQIRIRATDDQGNWMSVGSGLFTVDNQFTPNINVIAPVDNDVISGIYSILWTATDIDQSASTLDIKIEYRDPNNPNNGILSRLLSFFGILATHWIILEDLQDNNDGTFTWDTTQITNSIYQLRITVRDDNNNIATGFVGAFTVNNILPPLNNNPVITSTPILKAGLNQLYIYDVNAVDPDNDPLTYSLITMPIGMAIDASTGLITWTPNAVGNYDVIIQVNDNRAGVARQSFTINVINAIVYNGNQITYKHEFMISNVILRQNKNNLDVLINLKNEGNNKEDIKFIVTDLTTGKRMQNEFYLSINQGTWNLITLNNIGKGRHVIKVEAISKAFKATKYAYVNIK